TDYVPLATRGTQGRDTETRSDRVFQNRAAAHVRDQATAEELTSDLDTKTRTESANAYRSLRAERSRIRPPVPPSSAPPIADGSRRQSDQRSGRIASAPR